MNDKNQNNISRRQFLRTISIIPFLTIPTFSATNRNSRTKTFQRKRIASHVPLAGFQFYQGDKLWNKLTPTDSVEMIREPSNKFDKNAIMINWQNQQLGYIPRSDNKPLVALMDQGKQLSAEIVTLSKSTNPWKRIKLAIYVNG